MRVDLVVKDRDVSLRDILRALSNNLSAEDNFQAKIISVADTGTADVEFTVTHQLGKKPTFYIWNIDKAGIVYDSRRVDWTETAMFLKCSVANGALVLVVM